MALFPPGGNPNEIRLRAFSAAVAACLAEEFQSMARRPGLAASGAGAATVMGPTSGSIDIAVRFSGEGTTGACSRAGRDRRKATIGGIADEGRSAVVDLPRNTLSTSACTPATARMTTYRLLLDNRSASTVAPRQLD